MTVLFYFCQRFLTVFTQFNHLFSCWMRLWHILTEEADAAVKPHAGDVSFESARCVK